MRYAHPPGGVLCGSDGPTPSKSMSTEPRTQTENAQLPTILSSGPVDLVCPTDGTIVPEANCIEDTCRYECPTCGRVRSEEVLRR